MMSHTWVVEALNTMPRREQIPNPAATERATKSTPAMAIPLCDWIALFHLIREIQA